VESASLKRNQPPGCSLKAGFAGEGQGGYHPFCREKPMMTDPYKPLARWYDLFVKLPASPVRTRAVNICPLKPGMEVLEVGCGTGSNLKLFQQAGCSIHGIDLSPAMVNIARKKLGGGADVTVGDASRLPWSEESFDLVVAMLTLHEMPGYLRSRVVGEMSRVVKTNGRLLLVDFHPCPLRSPGSWLCRAVILSFEISAGREHFRNYNHFLAHQGLPGLINKNRLQVDRYYSAARGNIALFLAKKLDLRTI